MKRFPAGKLVLKDVPSSEVTVCVKVATFSQHTDCPCVIVALFGEKLREPVALMLAAAPLEPQDCAGAVELLQATATTKNAATPRPKIVRTKFPQCESDLANNSRGSSDNSIPPTAHREGDSDHPLSESRSGRVTPTGQRERP